jgi:hypothetical protein
VQWGGLRAGTDGERIVLIVPAFFEAHHVPYLQGVLEARLAALLGENVHLELQPGELARTPSSANYEPGAIVMSGISQPWPDGTALRTALEDAFKEAGEIEVEQVRLAEQLVEHLRSASGD